MPQRFLNPWAIALGLAGLALLVVAVILRRDPLGNVRPCNHSPTILGNIRRQSFAKLAGSPRMADFMAALPRFCSGCKLESSCQGGCKAAAEACFGSPGEADPFLSAFANQAVSALAGKPPVPPICPH